MPPTRRSPSKTSTLCAWPSAMQRAVGAPHVGGDPGAALAGSRRCVAQAAMTSSNARIGAHSPRRLRATRAGTRRQAHAPSVRNTMRGSGVHHRIGWPCGKPREDAVPIGVEQARRARDRRPTASRPSGSRSAESTGGNGASDRHRARAVTRHGAVRSCGAERRVRCSSVADSGRTECASSAHQGAIASAKVRIGDPVAAAHQRRQETARELVLALRAGFETLQALRAGSNRCPGSSRSRNAGRAPVASAPQ